jgi:2-dehydro-3-deoxygluconokinase
LRGHDLLYLSGITLSILDGGQRRALFEIVDIVRKNGGKIAFDGNFRPAGWPGLEDARACFDTMLSRTDIALPTFDDERLLMGTTSPTAVAERLHGLGVGQVVVKCGGEGCLLSDGDGERMVATVPVERVIDSTAAGDSFNAGFLAALLSGRTAVQAAQDGHRLAGLVLQHRGAIMPIDAMAALMS